MTKVEILAAADQGLTPAEIALQNHNYAVRAIPQTKSALADQLALVRLFALGDDLGNAEAALRQVANLRETLVVLNSML